MNKTAIHIWQTLLAGSFIFILAGCGVSTFKSTSAAPPTYFHYTPSDEFDVHLEFDYPSSWILSEEKFQFTDTMFVGLGDPRLLTIPTRAPDEPHGTPSDFGRIGIYVQPVKPDQTLDLLVEPHKQGYNSANWITPLNDYKIMIDGLEAIVFEYQVEPIDDNGYTSVMFERNLFFIVGDQLYQITFMVAEKERGDEFEQGYEYFFKSLKITP
jgi:hypothetical protein